jgi:putative hemolysin
MTPRPEKAPEYLRVPASNDFFRSIVNSLAGFTKFNSIYAEVIGDGIPDNLGKRFLSHCGAQVEINKDGLARIPRTGPLIIVANHPFGVVEGFILQAMVCSVRPDYKCLAAHMLAKLPGLIKYQFMVDPLKKSRKKNMNVAAWHGVFKWLRSGGVFAVFPAGAPSTFSLRQRAVTDPPWNLHIAALVRRSGAPVLPIYFPGRNSLFFQSIGLIYPGLQHTRLVLEFNKMRARRFKVLIGDLIKPDELAKCDNDQQLIDSLRARTYALASRIESADYVQFIAPANLPFRESAR